MAEVNTDPLGASDSPPVNVWRVLLGVIVGVVLFVAGTVFFLMIHMGAVWLVILGLGIPSIVAWALLKSSKTTKSAIQAFVTQNNLTPLTTEQMTTLLPPSMQNIGSSRKFSNGYLMTLDGRHIHLFDYAYDRLVEGRNGHKRFSIAVIQTNKAFPHVYIAGKQARSEPMYKASQKLGLEGDFNKYFTAYSETDLSVETLSFLTPDAMQVLIDTAQLFDLETYDHNLAVITVGTSMYVKSNMNRLLVCLKALMQKFPEGT